MNNSGRPELCECYKVKMRNQLKTRYLLLAMESKSLWSHCGQFRNIGGVLVFIKSKDGRYSIDKPIHGMVWLLFNPIQGQKDPPIPLPVLLHWCQISSFKFQISNVGSKLLNLNLLFQVIYKIVLRITSLIDMLELPIFSHVTCVLSAFSAPSSSSPKNAHSEQG